MPEITGPLHRKARDEFLKLLLAHVVARSVQPDHLRDCAVLVERSRAPALSQVQPDTGNNDSKRFLHGSLHPFQPLQSMSK